MLDKTKKDFKIDKLKKEKENFQTYLKELLIRGNPALILIFQICQLKHLLKGQIEENLMKMRRFFLLHHIFLNQLSHVKQVFLFSDGSLLPLRNKLPNIAPLPSKPTIDNFARPISQITDEKNNTIAITPKRPLPKIEERNLSQQLQSVFPDVNEAIKEDSESFKEKNEHLDEIINKVSNIDNDQDEQKTFEFEFFTGGTNQKFDLFIQKFGLSRENMEFLDFLQWNYCKEILENNDLKFHIETGNIYYKNNDTNELISEFMKNQQDSSKGKINFDLT